MVQRVDDDPKIILTADVTGYVEGMERAKEAWARKGDWD